jgi:hypothetical protein
LKRFPRETLQASRGKGWSFETKWGWREPLALPRTAIGNFAVTGANDPASESGEAVLYRRHFARENATKLFKKLDAQASIH